MLSSLAATARDRAVFAAKQSLPWWLVATLKAAIWHSPVPYRVWYQLRLSRHGHMADPHYALKTWRAFSERIGGVAGKEVVEIGPGDSWATAILNRAHTARRTVLVDIVPAAQSDPRSYASLFRLMRAEGLSLFDMDVAGTGAALLSAAACDYITTGHRAFRTLPAASLDGGWSHGALQFVPPAEVHTTLHDLLRVTRPGGRWAFRIPLCDMITGRLDHLRLSESAWNGPWWSRLPCYGNRLRAFQWRELFLATGWAIREFETCDFPALPTPRAVMAPPFNAMPFNALRPRYLDCVVERAA